jgi:hypothetical protein
VVEGKLLKIELQDLKVEQISNCSGVFSGDNLQVKWKSYVRLNEGYGEVKGDKNTFKSNRHTVVKVDHNGIDK